MGRRTSKTVGTATPTQYLYDGANAVQETVGSTINPILVGLGIDERFARNDTTGRTYFLTDAINSTVALTGTTGAIQNLYSYDPYGNTSESGTGFTNPYQYTGREADTSGLYYYRARYYSSLMGGMISEDPARFYGGQLSFYAYVGGNPLSYRDPRGHEMVLALVGTVIGGAAGYINGRIQGDQGDQLWEDAGTGAAVGLVGGLTNGLSFAAGFAGSAAWGEVAAGVVLRGLFAADMEGMRQANNYGCVTSFGDVALSGLFSVAGDFVGDYFGSGKQFEGTSEEAAGRSGTIFGGAASGAAVATVSASESNEGSGN
jgi:RHS repeat-associated protein